MASIAFAGHGMNRADNLRNDPEIMAQLRANATSRLLVMDGLIPVLDGGGCLTWMEMAGTAPEVETVFLGLKDGAALFAAVPTEGDNQPAYARRQIWSALASLSYPELSLYGGARSLVDWHARHRFCAQCGASTQLAKGGWQRDCGACKAQHFPRTDPVVIMLVEHAGRLLLGRGLNFPEGRYSALAGFIEPGESVEEAVSREVLEEAGVSVRNVSYVASQPWPFPSQLMIGCHGVADDDALTIDTTELADVRWFTRKEVSDALERDDEGGAFIPPPAHAIAYHLLSWWLERE